MKVLVSDTSVLIDRSKERTTSTARSSSKSPCPSTPSTPRRRGRSRSGPEHPASVVAAARSVIFAQMVDDPSPCPEEFPTEADQKQERGRLFRLIEELVRWENTTNQELLEQARAEIRRSWRRTCADNAGHPRSAKLFDPDRLPAFHDPFAGGGALPLEA